MCRMLRKFLGFMNFTVSITTNTIPKIKSFLKFFFVKRPSCFSYHVVTSCAIFRDFATLVVNLVFATQDTEAN